MRRPVFVFGSNLAGRHGKGAALFAKRERGAVTGVGFGHVGDSFAIPTKDKNLAVLPLEVIEGYFRQFVEYASRNEFLLFELTPIGTGLAGYKRSEMIRMIRKYAPLPKNVLLSPTWFE
jgi:hypothetical protein